jgi:CheY-like chemotaxis protein/signal transduction histidine kinase
MFALPLGTFAGFMAAFLAAVVVAVVSWRSLGERAVAADRVSQSLQVISQAQALLSTMKDAETGQRGFLLTGTERYLEPYTVAQANLPSALQSLRAQAGRGPREQQRIDALAAATAAKMSELAETIDLRRAGKTDEALSVVTSDRGKLAMDRIRLGVEDIIRDENTLLGARQAEWQDAARFAATVTIGGSALLLFLIAMAAAAASRDYRLQKTQEWIRAGQVGLAEVIAAEHRLDLQADRVLSFLAEYLQAQVGALYVADAAGALRRHAVYALPAGAAAESVGGHTNLLAQAVKDKRALRVDAVPEGYLPISSTLGSAASRTLLVAPALADGIVQGAVELGFFRTLDKADEALLTVVSETLGMAIRTARDRQRVQELLEETQRQAEELQSQQEELRVNNEELEEQGRALKESQAMMESQQAELEQSNSQLEAQAELLERQNQSLSDAQTALGERAGELERSNQVKSEFLANMSHELRTPLNSTLILARLLADNKEGNLNAEQVKFAETISSAGNDLLALINDILDLSKLEAGKVEVVSDTVSVARAVEGLKKIFEPMAAQRKLRFAASIDAGTPPSLQTDAQRVGQILRNLIANALKFTERGEVSLRVFAPDDTHLSFAVRDTGVGIEPQQREVIFEAFRQADGSTHRKFGGTGLGLSISRDLARLLGGDIALQSTPGSGSVFTLTLPRTYTATAPASAPSAGGAATVPASATSTREAAGADAATNATAARPGAPARTAFFDDDRERLRPDSRLILIIEDDPRFAAILRDLAHERAFQCVVAQSASEGLAAASTYRPSAIILDMNLPDHSGLGVLDQLKRNPHTRHIPVHVASVADYSREALERGAVGYALKPVKREELVQALKGLEAKFSQRLRHVLVVEDDARQLESISRLLEHEEVRIVGVASGSEALAKLQASTFDCMVMDLHLPDLSGYELLEKMASRDDVSFPPVIVYTGRSLTRDEEQRLRRHSKSIIIKDARSPERLLDEVTLFLHQVESNLPPDRQRMLREARSREATLEGRRILVVEDDVRNVFALSSVLEPKGAVVAIARNGREAIEALEKAGGDPADAIDLVLMDIMMPEMDGYTAMREIRKRPEWQRLPIIALTAKAMRDDQEKCLAAGANDYIAKPLDVERLLSLVRVWMPK